MISTRDESFAARPPWKKRTCQNPMLLLVTEAQAYPGRISSFRSVSRYQVRPSNVGQWHGFSILLSYRLLSVPLSFLGHLYDGKHRGEEGTLMLVPVAALVIVTKVLVMCAAMALSMRKDHRDTCLFWRCAGVDG